MSSELKIRKATSDDSNAIWDIFREVVKTGDTYVFDPNISKEDALKSWIGPKYHVYVAESDGKIVGTYAIKQNQQDLGSHIANGSYMVAPSGHGKGVGKAMALHSIEEATKFGFKAMQFNIVVSTNEPAVQLWKKVGFRIIGTIPKGFRHQKLGYVDAYIMYRELVPH